MAKKPPLAVDKFGGMVPILDDRALPDQFAAFSENVALYAQVLQGFAIPKLIYTLKSTTSRYTFRIPNDYAHTEINDPSIWMEFDHPDTSVIHTPTIDDQFDRYYWVEPGKAPMYNTAARIRAGSPPYLLGIPTPATAPGVVAPAATVTHTQTVKTPIGQTYLALDSIADIMEGMLITDTTDTAIQLATTAAVIVTDGKEDTLTFATTHSPAPGVWTGMAAHGVTQPGSVPIGSVVTGFNDTLVVIDPPFPLDVALGSVVQFDNVNQLPPGTTVVKVLPSTDLGPEVQMSAGAISAGVFVGDKLRFDAILLEARAYLYTWVSAYGEEGPPAPPTVVNGPVSGTWRITMTAPTAANMAQRNLTHTNLYRTVTSANGVATYFFVVQLPIGTLTYNDVLTDDLITGNNQLQSADWGAPPVTLKGMVSMPNGIILGWDGTDVLFCEPFRPHAWPSAYGLTTDYNVVGAGVYGQSGVLCTESVPHVVTGNHPAIMTMQKVNVIEPCLSKSSIVAGMQGVYYAGLNGLALVNPAGLSLVTKAIIGTRRWNQLVTPQHLRAVRYSGVYIAFDVDDASPTPPAPSAQFGCIIDPTDQRVSFCRVNNRTAVDNVLVDAWTGRMILLGSSSLTSNVTTRAVWEFDPPEETRQIAYTWKSKRFHARKKTNFGVLKVYFDQIGETNVDSQSLSANPWAVSNSFVLPTTVPIQFRLWADDRLVYDQPLFESGDQVSLPSGFKAEWWQFEIVGQVNVVSVHMGVDAKDLVQV